MEEHTESRRAQTACSHMEEGRRRRARIWKKDVDSEGMHSKYD